MDRTLDTIDRISWAFAVFAMVQIGIVCGAMLVEVVMRYGMLRPTLWANDIVYMMNGTLFLIGAAWTLRKNQHVRIDFLSTRLPVRVQHLINLVFYACVFLPLLVLVGKASLDKTMTAWRLGELEQMSAWEPYIWPFYAGLTIGIAALALQVVAEAVRHAIGIANPDRVYAPGASDEDAHV